MKLQKFHQQIAKIVLFGFLALIGLGFNAFAAPSSLDATFGVDGKTVSPVGKFSADYGYAAALQPDGKIVVAGRSSGGSNTTGFIIARINNDGSVDTSFGYKGFAGKKFFVYASSALAVAIQPDGKIIAAGYAADQTAFGNTIFTLVRFNNDGSIDTAFGTNGVAQTKFGSTNSRITSVAVQPNGKIVAVGFAHINNSLASNNFAIARFNFDGTLDNTFGVSGKVNLEFNVNTTGASAVITQPDGKILVGGYSNSLFQLVRLNADGALDTSFDADGVVSTQVNGGGGGISALAQQTDGKIVAAGSSYNGANNDVTVARYNSNGSLDTTFDADGIVMTDVDNRIDGASAVSVRADGKIVVGGMTSQSRSIDSRDFLAIRYNSNGSLDASFDNDGKALTNTSPTDELSNAMVIQPDGKTILVGYSLTQTYDVALIRYNDDGSLDVSFDNDGISLAELGNSTDIILDTAIQPDGKIIASGYSFNGTYNDITVVRYNPNGTFDASFGNSGVVTTSLGQISAVARRVLVQPDGKIVIGGNTTANNSDFVVVRYNPDGALDNSFGSAGISIFPVGNNADYLQDLKLQNDGKIVAVGQASGIFAVVRLLGNGSFDSSFGTGGKVLTSVSPSSSYAFAAAIADDGKIVLGGYGYDLANQGVDFVLARYNSNGTLDTTFDADGKVTTSFESGSNDAVNALSIQSDGKIIAAGYSNSNFALARYNSNGSLDVSFDGDGKLTTTIGANSYENQIYDLAVQPNGKIIAVGSAVFTGSSNSVIARYNSDGSLDNTFSSSGFAAIPSGDENNEFTSVSIQSDGKIIAAGYSSNGANFDFTLVRYQGGELPVKSRKRVRFIF